MLQYRQHLHFHASDDAVQFVVWKFVKLDDVWRDLLKKREYRPAEITRDNIRYTVKNGLFLNPCLTQDFFQIRHFHISRVYLERTKSRGKFLSEKTGNPERFSTLYNRNDDIIFINNIVLEHSMDNIRWYLLGIPGKEERRTLYLVHGLVNLVIALQKNVDWHVLKRFIKLPPPCAIENDD